MAVGYAPSNSSSPTSNYVGSTGSNANTVASESYLRDVSPLAFGGVSVVFSSSDEYIEAIIIANSRISDATMATAANAKYLTAAKLLALMGLILFACGLPLAFLKPDAIGALPFFLGGLLWFVSGYIGRVYDK